MSLIGELRQAQLSRLGIDHADITVLPDLPPVQLAQLMGDINAVGQYLYTHDKGVFWGTGPQGDRLRAPVNLTAVTTTDGSKTVACADFASWMNGCTLRILGEWNRLFQAGASTWQLLIPANASSASNAATVYHDCLNLTDTSITIEDVILDGQWRLDPVSNLSELENSYGLAGGNPVYTNGVPNGGWRGWSNDRIIATPSNYAVDGTQLYGGSYITQLRVNPLPDRAYAMRWTQREKFTKVTAWSDARTTIIPHEYHESVFIPLVLEKLLKHPAYEGNGEAIVAEANLAREIMKTLSQPQINRPVRFAPSPY